MIDFIIIVILGVAMGMAAKYIISSRKKGKCVG